MWDIYLKFNIEEKWYRYPKLNFLSLKGLSLGQYLGSSTHTDVIEVLNFFLQFKIRCLGGKLCVDFLLTLLNFKGIEMLRP